MFDQLVENRKRVIIVARADGALHKAEFEIQILRLEHEGLAIRCFGGNIPTLAQTGKAQQPKNFSVAAAQRNRSCERLDGLGVFAVANESKRQIFLCAAIVGEFEDRRLKMFRGVGQVFALEINIAQREIKYSTGLGSGETFERGNDFLGVAVRENRDHHRAIFFEFIRLHFRLGFRGEAVTADQSALKVRIVPDCGQIMICCHRGELGERVRFCLERVEAKENHRRHQQGLCSVSCHKMNVRVLICQPAVTRKRNGTRI